MIFDGVQRGCKKIMVLYMSMERGGKAEKTNWVMHQYHLGTAEEEQDGEYVISKIFYQQQQQQVKQVEKIDQDFPETTDPVTVKAGPVTPDPPPHTERRCSKNDLGQDITVTTEVPLAQVEFSLSLSLSWQHEHSSIFCYENMLFHIFCLRFTIVLVTNRRLPFLMSFWTPFFLPMKKKELRRGMLGLITENSKIKVNC